MGGVRTDLDGRTSLPGLYAAGEVAASGVHGANRLASNSLLEGVVFGRRVARAVVDRRSRAGLLPLTPADSGDADRSAVARQWLRTSMVERAGVVRTPEGLAALAADLDSRAAGAPAVSAAKLEVENLFELARSLVGLALAREESRGAHYRTDYPVERARWHCHQLVATDGDGELTVWRVPVGAPPLAAPPPEHAVAVAS